MTNWAKVTLSSDDDLRALVSEARYVVFERGCGDGIGVFRDRMLRVLYFSPGAVAAIDPGTGLAFEECARPDAMRVLPAVGAYDDPAAYDPLEGDAELEAQLDLFEQQWMSEAAGRQVRHG